VLQVGKVTVGDEAKAWFRKDARGFFILDLVLPRAEKGDRGEKGDSVVGPSSNVPGPEGKPGRDGRDGLDSTTPGPVGAEGPQGIPGVAGMTREEIIQVLVETLQNVGVMTEQAQKLIAVRAKLKAAIHSADERHQSQYGKFLRGIDREIF
jgi:hypothetical protein